MAGLHSYSYLQYALPVRGSTYKNNLQKLLRLQNKAVKFIASGQWNDSHWPLTAFDYFTKN